MGRANKNFALVGLNDGTVGGLSGIHTRSSLGALTGGIMADGCLVIVGAILGGSCGKMGGKIGRRVGRGVTSGGFAIGESEAGCATGLAFVGRTAVVGAGVGSKIATGATAAVGATVGTITATGGHCDLLQHCFGHNVHTGVN